MIHCLQPSHRMGELIHDIIIIGAGPCGLAVAARLRESTPSALFTDDEHQRDHWIRRHSGLMAVLKWRSGITQPARQVRRPPYSMLVVDSSSDRWLARWNRLFGLLEIKELRSPMFFHVDPRDRDALLAFAYEEERPYECSEITGCVGKEKSKHYRKKSLRSTTYDISDSRGVI